MSVGVLFFVCVKRTNESRSAVFVLD